MTSAAPPPKGDWRARVSAARRARSPQDRDSARAAVRDVVLERRRLEGWRCVAAYVPLPSEPGSPQLLDALAALGVRVLVPLTRPDRDLEWTAWPDTSHSLGLDALAEADVVLVPALAVATTDGTRLGRGGGSYDRALGRRSPGVVVAALLFDGETVAALPSEPWDVPVSAVVSPSGWTWLPLA